MENNHNDNSVEYKMGVSYFNSNEEFKKIPKLLYEIHEKLLNESNKNENSISFNNGFYDAYNEYWNKFHKTEEFKKELSVVLDKYNATIDFGCGCCGGGFNIKGFEFNF